MFSYQLTKLTMTKSALLFLVVALNFITFNSHADNSLTNYIESGKPLSPWKLTVGNAFAWGEPVTEQKGKTQRGNLTVSPSKRYADNDTLIFKWRGRNSKSAWFSNVTLNGRKIDLSSIEDKAALNIELKIHRKPTSIAKIAMRCNWSNKCENDMPLNPLLDQLPTSEWTALVLPLNCFNQNGKFDFANLTDIFAISTQGKMELEIANVNLVSLPAGNKGCKK
ncbi:putative glycoside hydrolase [Catenovulum maritimum]|nr:putative glycoside hydrolase [Catenovulum maritimum]